MTVKPRTNSFHVGMNRSFSLALIFFANFAIISTSSPSDNSTGSIPLANLDRSNVLEPDSDNNQQGEQDQQQQLPVHYRLEQYIMSHYNNRLIPRRLSSHPIEVSFSIGLYQIIEVNEPQQYILLNSWIVERWEDELLYWDSADFEGLTEIVLPRSSIWIPDTTLYNSLVMDDAASRRILNVKVTTLPEVRKAWVEMLYPTLYQFSCTLDLRFFPFDIQKCRMIFGSWTHDNKNLDYKPYNESNSPHSPNWGSRRYRALEGTPMFNLDDNWCQKFPEGGIGTDHCIENEGWNILATEVLRCEKKFHCCANNYTLIKYFLHIQRKPLFYLMNLIIPTSMITLIAIVGFFSSSAVNDLRDEKISLGITTLLSMSILIFMVSDQMPSTSSFIPLIGWFYTSMMGLIGGGTIAASFVIYVQKKGIVGQRPSSRTMRWARRLGKLIMMEMPLLMKQAYALKAKSYRPRLFAGFKPSNSSGNSATFASFVEQPTIGTPEAATPCNGMVLNEQDKLLKRQQLLLQQLQMQQQQAAESASLGTPRKQSIWQRLQTHKMSTATTHSYRDSIGTSITSLGANSFNWLNRNSVAQSPLAKNFQKASATSFIERSPNFPPNQSPNPNQMPDNINKLHTTTSSREPSTTGGVSFNMEQSNEQQPIQVQPHNYNTDLMSTSIYEEDDNSCADRSSSSESTSESTRNIYRKISEIERKKHARSVDALDLADAERKLDESHNNNNFDGWTDCGGDEDLTPTQEQANALPNGSMLKGQGRRMSREKSLRKSKKKKVSVQGLSPRLNARKESKFYPAITVSPTSRTTAFNYGNPMVTNAAGIMPLSELASALGIDAEEPKSQLQRNESTRRLENFIGALRAARRPAPVQSGMRRSTSTSIADLYATTNMRQQSGSFGAQDGNSLLNNAGTGNATPVGDDGGRAADQLHHPAVQRNLAEIEYDWLAAVVERLFLFLFLTLFFLMSFGINGIGVYYWYFTTVDDIPHS